LTHFRYPDVSVEALTIGAVLLSARDATQRRLQDTNIQISAK
jgi:hypothetical protein